jgi:hypothetical protein
MPAARVWIDIASPGKFVHIHAVLCDLVIGLLVVVISPRTKAMRKDALTIIINVSSDGFPAPLKPAAETRTLMDSVENAPRWPVSLDVRLGQRGFMPVQGRGGRCGAQVA